MAYSTDFKQRALDSIKEGHSHVEAAKFFWCWRQNSLHVGKERREQGHIERKKESSKTERFL